MVEGKLQSWGRAETVIKILDTDAAHGALEATLEEIVEAVRNCGDRQSSLVYLQQDCQCCYTLYPMSKVCKLYKMYQWCLFSSHMRYHTFKRKVCLFVLFLNIW